MTNYPKECNKCCFGPRSLGNCPKYIFHFENSKYFAAWVNWFSSYLSDRRQYVEINGVSSTLLSLKTEVPQGSILGPLLFLIYMNDIPQASSHFKFILYADDTTLFSIIQLQSASDTDINQELIRVHDWLAVNRLSLNIKKTKYIIFHAINKSTDGLFSELRIDGINIERVTTFNFLIIMNIMNICCGKRILILSAAN